MTEQRQQPQAEQPQQPEEGLSPLEAAAAIAALVVAGTATAGAVAAVLTLLRGISVPSVPRAAAEMVLSELPQRPTPGDQLMGATWWSNLIYRGLYGVNAAQRLQDAHDAALKADNEELYRSALIREGAYFHDHLEASEQRRRGAQLNGAAMERFGPVLGWVHLGTARTHRKEHERAHGKNYDPLSPPISTKGYLPGQARHCDCTAGPPQRGAEMLV